MPVLKNKLPMFGCKCLRLRQFLDLQPLRFAQFHAMLELKHGLTATAAHVHVYGPVFVAAEEEHVTVLLEDPWHVRILPYGRRRGEQNLVERLSSPLTAAP